MTLTAPNAAIEAACAALRASVDAGPVFFFTGPTGLQGQRKSDPTPFQQASDYARHGYSVFRNGVIRPMTADEQRAWKLDGKLPVDEVPVLQMAAE